MAASEAELRAGADRAAALRQQGRPDAAAAEYRALLALRPGWSHALTGLGLCARAQGDLPQAERHFAAALAADPHNRWIRLEYATALREQARWAEATAEYASLAAAHPDWGHGLAGLGLCARAQGDLPQAERHFAAALAAAPQDRWVRLEYATTLREQGRLAPAEAEYATLLAAHPGWFHPLAGLALCAQRQGDLPAAARHFAAALAVAPHDTGARLEYATTLRELGQLADARAAYRALLAQQPDSLHGLLGLGHCARLDGDRDAALAAFLHAHRCWPDEPYPLAEAVAEAHALGRRAEATAWLRAAVQRPALAAMALTLLGEQARLAQDFDAALDLLGRAAARPDAPPGAALALAHTLADVGRIDDALAALDTPPAASHDAAAAACLRIYLLRRAGRPDAALAAARAACAALPTHVPLRLERFEAERLRAPPGEHLDALLDATPASSVSDRARLHHARGLLAEQRWQLEAAAAQFRAALALDATLAWTHDALARVSLKLCDPAAARAHLLAKQQLDAPALRAQGVSAHLTHTHMGQILDEFLMDPATLRRVAATAALPGAQRIDALRQLARAAPGHTPTAIALLTALRRLGWLTPPAGAPPADMPGEVPARIVQYWDQPSPPDDIAALMHSWQAHNPGHAYRRFDVASAGEYLRAHYAREVVQAYRRARGPAMKADLFRLAWLAREGGVYADADDRCLRPLATFVPPHAELAVYQEEHGTLGNNFIAARRGHPVLDLALRHAVTAINRGDDDLLWLATGPGLLTRALAETLATTLLRVPDWLARIAILDRHELAQGVAVHCAAGYKITPRHWVRMIERRTGQEVGEQDKQKAGA